MDQEAIEMDINKLQDLVQLAGAADILDNANVQTMIHATALDDDVELFNDVKEFFSYKALGKLTSPDPFYPLPRCDVTGGIEVGMVGDTEFPFGLSLNEMTQHVLLAGRSGSGKTTLLYNVMNQLLDRGIKFWVIDLKREFRGFLRKSDDVIVLRPENFKLNPLRPPDGIPPLRWLSIFSDVFSHSTSLLEGSNSFLLDQGFNLYELYKVFDGSNKYPSFHELLRILEHIYIPLSTRDARYLESVRNRVLSCVLTAGDMLDCDKDMLKDLMEQNKSVVFEFYGISEHVVTFLIEMLLTKLYYYRMAKGRKQSQGKPMVVLLDEARNIYDYRKEMNPASGIPIIDTMIERIRDFGVSLVICSQIPFELCISAKSNTYTKIMMSLGNGQDISDLAKCMGLDKNQEEFSYGLNVGEAIVKLAGRYTKPFWIRTPKVSIEKDISDSEIEQKTRSVIAEFEVTPVSNSMLYENYVDRLKEKSKARQRVEAISDIAKNLLVNIFKKPYIPVTRRYESLGLSRKKGKVVKDYLIQNKYAAETNIKISNKVSNYLTLSKKGLSLCEKEGLKNQLWTEVVSKKISFCHKLYQFLINYYLTQDGWIVRFERVVNGTKRTKEVSKKADMIAEYKIEGKVVKSIAVEVVITNYEVYTIMNCVDNGFDEIWIVCKDEKARKKIENDIYAAIDETDRDFVIVQTINGFLNNMPKKP